jgi:hypothetical protein
MALNETTLFLTMKTWVIIKIKYTLKIKRIFLLLDNRILLHSTLSNIDKSKFPISPKNKWCLILLKAKGGIENIPKAFLANLDIENPIFKPFIVRNKNEYSKLVNQNSISSNNHDHSDVNNQQKPILQSNGLQNAHKGLLDIYNELSTIKLDLKREIDVLTDRMKKVDEKMTSLLQNELFSGRKLNNNSRYSIFSNELKKRNDLSVKFSSVDYVDERNNELRSNLSTFDEESFESSLLGRSSSKDSNLRKSTFMSKIRETPFKKLIESKKIQKRMLSENDLKSVENANEVNMKSSNKALIQRF